ncbi:MAG: hypothetical protein ACREA7_09865 [Nitrosotalea sp.]
MSKGQSIRFTRKRRYALFAIVTSIGVAFALYNALNDFSYTHSKEWNFDSYQNNTIPADYAAFQSDSKPGLWVVKYDDSAPSQPNVLTTLPTANSSGYHMQIMPDSPIVSDAAISVKIKIIPGHTAEQAGLIVRFMDPSHYFVLMLDPINNRISLCKSNTEFLICSYEARAQISVGEWHTLEATISSQGIGGWLDGTEIIKANNEYYETGQIGLWTKDNTEAYFDDMKIKY